MKKFKKKIILFLIFALFASNLSVLMPNNYIYANELDDIYYYDNNSTMQSRTIWDFADIALAGASWYTLTKDPSLKNLGWALLDTAAIAPLIPSTAYIRKGSKYVVSQKSIEKLAKTKKGKSEIRKALTTVAKSTLSSKDLNKALSLARKYKLTNKQYTNHILKNHAHNTKLKNKSKFLKEFNIKSGIKETLKDSNKITKNTNNRPGYIYIKKFSKPVGVDSKGKKVYQLKVVLDSAGSVVTAYPY